ncbi:MAG: PQQ-dependent sugar dehydrogenase [Gemmatimonadota bacterium]|nr:PQQ-dependent sugar dehydrogenase [Gemmatimonadota bacterium]
MRQRTRVQAGAGPGTSALVPARARRGQIARLAAIVLLAAACSPSSAASAPDPRTTTEPEPTAQSPAGQVAHEVVTVVRGLSNPWSLAWLPNGDMLVTEQSGRLRIVRDGELLAEAVQGVPEVVARGQGGLLDVALHPDFETNRLLYLSYARPREGGGASTGVVRGRLQDDALVGLEQIWVAQSAGRNHYGSRLAFDAEGYLYVTAGDRQVSARGGLAELSAHPSQDLSTHYGVVVRLHDDGRIPADNPFVGRDGALADIYSYGHRNPQGLAFHPETGDLWLNEHGPQGGDEVNLILPGRNYGWPVVGHGVNYGSGTRIHVDTNREGMEPPVHYWVPSIAPSGLLVYTGDRFEEWRGSMFVGGLAGQQLARLSLEGRTVTGEETLVRGMGRIRDVRQGPDGLIYLVFDSPGMIARLEPAGG